MFVWHCILLMWVAPKRAACFVWLCYKHFTSLLPSSWLVYLALGFAAGFLTLAAGFLAACFLDAGFGLTDALAFPADFLAFFAAAFLAAGFLVPLLGEGTRPFLG